MQCPRCSGKLVSVSRGSGPLQQCKECGATFSGRVVTTISRVHYASPAYETGAGGGKEQSVRPRRSSAL